MQLQRETDYYLKRQQKSKEKYINDDIFPHRYVLVLTNKCNLRCSFCFQDKSHLPGSLDYEGWKKLNFKSSCSRSYCIWSKIN